MSTSVAVPGAGTERSQGDQAVRSCWPENIRAFLLAKTDNAQILRNLLNNFAYLLAPVGLLNLQTILDGMGQVANSWRVLATWVSRRVLLQH
jgi:hypothetical protein